MLDDKHLVEECIKNKEGALDELYKRFASKMFGICLRYVRSKAEAEDILHEGFIKVFNNLKYYRFEGSLDGWLRRIMVNAAINYYRKSKSRYDDIDVSNIKDNKVVDEDVISQLSTKDLLSFIQDLPDGYRMVFNLYVIEGYTHKEIGEKLNIAENTSKSQLSKARKVLQKRVKEEFYEKTV
jgi:RNA polymerase sigma-70 factor (ECF subfamily)